jgi:UDP-N-acetylmuramate-alanine ligase
VVCVTGTAGKTTVKEMLAQVAGQRFSVAKNYKNWNNQIGLPLSIFAASGQEDVWVLEAGISKPNDMDELGFIVAPDLAVIHNIGPAHLQGLGDLRMAVNLSAHQLRQGNLATRLQWLAKAYGFRPGDLELEITESITMETPEVTVALLCQFRELGVELAIDDFGSGY